MTLQEIPIDSIEISPFNARKGVSEEKLDELANSIREIGLQQPVVVYRKRGKYELIIGQRRYLACRKLALDKIWALVVPVRNETEARIRSFSENIHRLDLGYTDKMRVAAGLRGKLGSVAKVAAVLGVHPNSVRNYLGWAGVPEPLKRMAGEGKISPSLAARIAKSIDDEALAVQIAERMPEIASSDRRRAIVEMAKLNPGSTVAEVESLVAKQRLATMTLHLTTRLVSALDTASQEYQQDREDIALAALEEWLSTHGFLK
jgi:ParB family chromosome partitioning protein